jgi:hypothetical protein
MAIDKIGDLKTLGSGKSKHWLLKQNFLITGPVKRISLFSHAFFQALAWPLIIFTVSGMVQDVIGQIVTNIFNESNYSRSWCWH